MKHIYQNILILAFVLIFLLAGKEAGAVPSPEVTPDYTVSFIATLSITTASAFLTRGSAARPRETAEALSLR